MKFSMNSQLGWPSLVRKRPIKRLAILAGRYYFCIVIQKNTIINAKDLTELHTLVEKFEGEMSLKDICSQEGVDYRGYISWRKRNGLSRSSKATAPAGMIEVEVAALDTVSKSVSSVS